MNQNEPQNLNPELEPQGDQVEEEEYQFDNMDNQGEEEDQYQEGVEGEGDVEYQGEEGELNDIENGEDYILPSAL